MFFFCGVYIANYHRDSKIEEVLPFTARAQRGFLFYKFNYRNAVDSQDAAVAAALAFARDSVGGKEKSCLRV